MIPVVTPEEMAAIDAAAPEPVEVLIERAGAAVARAALDLLGGTYGRRVVVVAGKGNNGADGRSAARRLERRGVQVQVLDAAALPDRLPACDLVVDAAFGTGFRGEWQAPDPGGAPVLAVDIPSGVDGCTGEVGGRAMWAVHTVTFAALKPGLLLGDGRGLAGEVEVVDIGLDTSRARAHLVEDVDVADWLPERPVDSHKWRSAVWIVAGSPGMAGAAVLAARGAQRSGAGYVRLSTPGGHPGDGTPTEVVATELPATGWADAVVDGAERFRALVVGPGLGRSSDDDVRRLVASPELRAPLVVDGDGLTALGRHAAGLVARPDVVLTPHDGEHERLAGGPPGPDRIAAARDLAGTTGATVLLKGTTTVVAEPGGGVLVVTAGDARLATAGTGDVLAGVVAALLAAGVAPLQAAAAAAHVHGRAGTLGWRRGLVAGDLADLVPAYLARLPQRSADAPHDPGP